MFFHKIGFKINKYNEEASTFNITFIARNQTFSAVKQKGLIMHSPEFENNVTIPNLIFDQISAISDPDLVLICVKEYDLENVCLQLKEVIKKETIILPLMNGVNIVEKIRKTIFSNPILPSCVYVASHIKLKGEIEHKGLAGKIILGMDKEFPEAELEWIICLFQDSHINFDWKENPTVDIWKKFLLVASFGLVTAKYNSSFDMVCNDLGQRQEALEIMKEIIAIAIRKGIDLGVDVINKTFEKALTFPPNTPSSLQLDINQNKKNHELELFAGTIIHLGIEMKAKTPFTAKIYSELKS